jgi:hypothetical protein
VSSPIKDALQTLSRHADLVSEGLERQLDTRTGTPASAILALRQASALRPAGEDGYRLHPRLREYLFDHLQMYPAYSDLSEIGSNVSRLKSLWIQIEDMISAGEGEATMRLREALQDTVLDVADSLDRNLLKLQNLLSTSYGNVKTLAAKKSQNKWYQEQSSALIMDLARLSTVGSDITRNASVMGLHELTRFIRRSLLARMSAWQHGLSEMQTRMRNEIFRTHQVEINHRQLARLDMLMRQQPGWTGVEVDLEAAIPDFLLRARLPVITPHVEPFDGDADVQRTLEECARSLPPMLDSPPPAEAPKKVKRLADTKTRPRKTPAMLAAERLNQHVRQATDAVSVMQWRKTDLDAMSLSPNVWLVFATLDLRSRNIDVTPLTPYVPLAHKIRRRDVFFDAMARGPKCREAKA